MNRYHVTSKAAADHTLSLTASKTCCSFLAGHVNDIPEVVVGFNNSIKACLTSYVDFSGRIPIVQAPAAAETPCDEFRSYSKTFIQQAFAYVQQVTCASVGLTVGFEEGVCVCVRVCAHHPGSDFGLEAAQCRMPPVMLRFGMVHARSLLCSCSACSSACRAGSWMLEGRSARSYGVG